MIRLVQRLFSSMSLERKSLLFFGSAFTILMCGAFLVVQTLGKRLVRRTAQQRAQDLADFELLLLHSGVELSNLQPADPQAKTLQPADQDTESSSDETDQENAIVPLTDQLRAEVQSDDVQFTLLGVDAKLHFENLPEHPTEDPQQQRILQDLEPQFRQQLTQRLESLLSEEPLTEIDAEENAMPSIGLASLPVHQEVGPVDGRYSYYRPIFPTALCVDCHRPYGDEALVAQALEGTAAERAALAPMRVMMVTMPYKDTEDQTTWISSIVVALALFIVAATLYILHALIRYLVLEPLYHIRDVSDAITHGDVSQRASIESEDEFRELADAFNRMLRGMLDSQEKERVINAELDERADQLAQINLQLYEANRVKSDFMANMSHELRTPLNSIIGFSEVLHGIDSLTDKQRRYAQNIQTSGRLLLEMINDILDLAKVEAGKMEVRRSEFDLRRLITAQCDMVGSLTEEKEILVTTDFPDDLQPAFQDPNKLGQICNNLLSNAIKFTPEGGRVTVRVADLSGGLSTGRFRLLVIDTGVGIADEDQSIIFQKFRQSRKVLDGEGLTREFAGTGLGLSIVKELAKLLGGEVGFESELGRGSTFWVELPWRLSDEALQAAQQLADPSRFAIKQAPSEADS